MNSLIIAMGLLSIDEPEHVFVHDDLSEYEPSLKRAKLSNDNDNLIDSVLFATPFTGAFVGILSGPFTGFTQIQTQTWSNFLDGGARDEEEEDCKKKFFTKNHLLFPLVKDL